MPHTEAGIGDRGRESGTGIGDVGSDVGMGAARAFDCGVEAGLQPGRDTEAQRPRIDTLAREEGAQALEFGVELAAEDA